MSPDKRTLDELRIDRTTAIKHRPKGWLVPAALGAVAVCAVLLWRINRPGAAVVRTIVEE